MMDNELVWQDSFDNSFQFNVKNRRTIQLPPLYQLTVNYNKWIAGELGAKYIRDTTNYFPHLPPHYNKVGSIIKHLKNYDIVIMLDTDAWIRSIAWIKELINKLYNDTEKIGMASRDPYLEKNTYINSGVLILKNSFEINRIYSEINDKIKDPSEEFFLWPFEQRIVSDMVFRNRELFYIFKPEILNTPNGRIVRHFWFKGQKGKEQLINDLISNLNTNSEIKNALNFNDFIDSKDYPNQIITFKYKTSFFIGRYIFRYYIGPALKLLYRQFFYLLRNRKLKHFQEGGKV